MSQVGKETGGKNLEGAHSLKANEMAEVVFEPCQPLIVESFKVCEGLSRIAFLDGNTAVMVRAGHGGGYHLDCCTESTCGREYFHTQAVCTRMTP